MVAGLEILARATDRDNSMHHWYWPLMRWADTVGGVGDRGAREKLTKPKTVVKLKPVVKKK